MSHLNPAVQASTRSAYPGGMEGRVDLGADCIPRWFTHPSSNHLIATWLGVKPQIHNRTTSTSSSDKLLNGDLLVTSPNATILTHITDSPSASTEQKLKREWLCRVLHPALHIIGHFKDESFQANEAITCTGADSENEQQKKSNKLTQLTQATIVNYLYTQ